MLSLSHNWLEGFGAPSPRDAISSPRPTWPTHFHICFCLSESALRLSRINGKVSVCTYSQENPKSIYHRLLNSGTSMLGLRLWLAMGNQSCRVVMYRCRSHLQSRYIYNIVQICAAGWQRSTRRWRHWIICLEERSRRRGAGPSSYADITYTVFHFSPFTAFHFSLFTTFHYLLYTART